MINPARKSKNKVMADINITPFTDVLLVLLVILMVMAPQMKAANSKGKGVLENAMGVNLPAAKASLPMEKKQDVEVSVKADQTVYVNGNKMSLPDMTAALQRMNAGRPIDVVIVQADKTVPYARVVQVMDHVKQAGLTNIALPTKTATMPGQSASR